MTTFFHFPRRQLARERGISRSPVGQLARERSDSPSVRKRTAYDSTGELPRNLAGFLRTVRTINPHLPRPLR